MSDGRPPAIGSTPAVSSVRLLSTMGGAGALAGLLIVLAYQFTLPSILANRAERLERAILEVVPGSTAYEPLYEVAGALKETLPPGVDGKDLPKIYAAVDQTGTLKGYAIPASATGFADVVDVIFGFDPGKPGTLGLVIVNSRETPGLGDKVEAPAWREQFDDAGIPLVGVKAGQAQKPEEVEMVTGATITSRTVIGAINKALERWKPLIDAHRAGGGS
jgi:electron transport complex protein RnfG